MAFAMDARGSLKGRTKSSAQPTMQYRSARPSVEVEKAR